MAVSDSDYSLDFENIDFRERPYLYRVGRGEQGVLSVEPYKSELLPHWRFRTEEVARESVEKIYSMFLEYKARDDFVGMDMARKFLQMGFTGPAATPTARAAASAPRTGPKSCRRTSTRSRPSPPASSTSASTRRRKTPTTWASRRST